MEYDAEKIGNRLREARESREMSIRELAKHLDLNPSTLSRYESAEITKIKLPVLTRIATILSVDPMWLVGLTDQMVRADATPKSKTIPLVGTIAAGIPIFAEQNVEDWYNVDERLHIDFAVRVQGDSMVGASIKSGDIALIRRQPTVENGEIAAVLIGDEATLKRVYFQNGEIILQAENPKYTPTVVTQGNLQILGKLVGIYSNRE